MTSLLDGSKGGEAGGATGAELLTTRAVIVSLTDAWIQGSNRMTTTCRSLNEYFMDYLRSHVLDKCAHTPCPGELGLSIRAFANVIDATWHFPVTLKIQNPG